MIKNDKGEWIINPDSAVAILEEFNKKHPDFPLEAAFFINDNVPFEQKEQLGYKLKYIIDKGMDIGNHTNTHVGFTAADSTRIQSEISGIVKMVGQYVPGYELNTLTSISPLPPATQIVMKNGARFSPLCYH